MEQKIITIKDVAADYYKISEVAEIFNVTRRTIYRWINRGKLRRCRFGKPTYIPKEDVGKLIEEFKRIRAPKEKI